MPNTTELIERFLDGSPFAVVGASPDRSKYGNKVLRAYAQAKLAAYPIHPQATEVEGKTVYPNLSSLPEPVHGVSVIVPPSATLRVLNEAAELGIQNIWLQPGAESDEVLTLAEELGLDVIANGPCVLVALGYRER